MSDLLRITATDEAAIAAALEAGGLMGTAAAALARGAQKVADSVGGGARYEDLYRFFDAVAHVGREGA